MKKLLFFIPALILFAVSCEKEENSPFQTENELVSEVKMITEVVSGGRGESTKATISDSDASFAWTAGDNVAVHVSNGDSHKYVITSSGASVAAASASFSVQYEKGYARDAFAVYPSTIVAATAANYGQSGQPLDVTLPSSYTLDQVSGETSPCPMVSTNAPNTGWDFYQLCGLLRLTVNSIPPSTKRLEIDFNGKKVWGVFSITFPVIPGTSNIDTADDAAKDCITVTKDGTDAVLGETSLTINIPLPAGTYNKISVIAYDEISGGNALYAGFVPFALTVDHTYATKKATTLGPLQGTFTFTFKDKDTTNELGGLRFVRLFSCQNKLYNDGGTTLGPYTDSRATGDNNDMENPIEATLKFAPDADDQLAFQVIDASGKVYSGLYDVFTKGYSSNMTVDVKAYTFTVASGKKVYFSPGDLGVDKGEYSFTEPFARWGGEGATNAATRVYFEGSEARPDKVLYGITWRLQTWTNSTDNEWKNLIARTMEPGVNPYYKVQVGSNKYCVLLPPDETTSSDISDDLTTQVTDYVKYIAKGFVILMNTNYKGSDDKWGNTNLRRQGGFYWTNRSGSPADRTLFNWYTGDPTTINASTAYHCLHVRFVRNVE